MNAVYRDTYSRSRGTSGSVVSVSSRGSLHTRKANVKTTVKSRGLNFKRLIGELQWNM